MRRYGHVLSMGEEHIVIKSLVEGLRRKGRPKKTWIKQVEEESKKAGSLKEGTSLLLTLCTNGDHQKLGRNLRSLAFCPGIDR